MKSTIALIAFSVLSTSAHALPPMPMMMAGDTGFSREADVTIDNVSPMGIMEGDQFVFPSGFEFKKNTHGKYSNNIADVCTSQINVTSTDLDVVQLSQTLTWKVSKIETVQNARTEYLYTLTAAGAPGRTIRMSCSIHRQNLAADLQNGNVKITRTRQIERINYDGEEFGKQARIRLDGELPDGSFDRRPVWDGITDTRRPGGGKPGTR